MKKQSQKTEETAKEKSDTLSKIQEKAKKAAEDLKDVAARKASELRKTAEEKANEFRNVASGKYNQFRDVAEVRYKDAVTKASDVVKEGEKYVKENPTRSVLTALGVGLVVGLILRKK